MKKLAISILGILIFTSCSKEEISIEEDSKKSLLVIGNSITYSPTGGEWTGNWGMAATSPEKDFCGILNKSYDLDKKNIAIWENNFNCDVEYYYLLTTKHYDYCILKIGENVGDIDNFKQALYQLTDYYSNYSNNIVLVTTVWKQYDFDLYGNPFEVPSAKDLIIEEVASEKGYIIVNISEMKDDNTMYAWNEYQDSAIGSHPNDKGMEFIANKIKQAINSN